jgi:hypothetical protein
MSNINWVKLVTQNRAKAMGVPWTPEEAKLVNEWRKDNSKGVHPDDVRSGKYLEKKKIADKPVHHLKKEELIEKAKELEIEFDETVIQRGDLILLVNQKLKNEENTKGTIRGVKEDGGVEE